MLMWGDMINFFLADVMECDGMEKFRNLPFLPLVHAHFVQASIQGSNKNMENFLRSTFTKNTDLPYFTKKW